MKKILLLTICWSIIADATAEELSHKVLDFLTYIIGDVDNKVQVDLEGADYDFIQVRARRVHVPSLEPNVTLFIEQATNGVIQFFLLGVVRDGPANTITLKIYNFTDYSDVKFGSYDLGKFSQVKPEQLESDEKCVAYFEIWGKGFMTGRYPYCSHTNNGTHPYLTITYTCDLNTAIHPPNLGQKDAIAPYFFQHRFVGGQLEGAPKDYISPCNY